VEEVLALSQTPLIEQELLSEGGFSAVPLGPVSDRRMEPVVGITFEQGAFLYEADRDPSSGSANSSADSEGQAAPRAAGAAGSVVAFSSGDASQRFTQDEARAQAETAEKLGLAAGGAPLTTTEVQDLLQRVIQKLRGSVDPAL
jgi:hypothetical protein